MKTAAQNEEKNNNLGSDAGPLQTLETPSNEGDEMMRGPALSVRPDRYCRVRSDFDFSCWSSRAH